jgi:hypothetical protein
MEKYQIKKPLCISVDKKLWEEFNNTTKNKSFVIEMMLMEYFKSIGKNIKHIKL